MTINNSTVKTWRERIGATADFPLHAPTDVERAMEAEIAELRDQQVVSVGRAPATAELLKILAVADPFASGQQGQWFERLCAARADQQPLPVPQGAVIIWRCDLVRAVAELLQLRAYREHYRAKDGTESSQAARDVLAERRRQVAAEGMTTDGDDRYHAAELPRAAASYILNGANDVAPYIWPWAKPWWKPRDARANYVRAAALLLAEIERIDRAAAKAQGGDAS